MMSNSNRACPAGCWCHDLCANLLLDRAQIEKYRLAPELVPSKVPDDQRANPNTLSGGSKAKERPAMRPTPLVFGHDALLVRGKEALYSDLEIGKTCPMFEITLGHLFRADKGLWHANDVVEAIGRHPVKESFQILSALRLDVLAKHGHSFLRYPHLVNPPGHSTQSPDN